MCRWEKKGGGNCRYGNNCSFSHETHHHLEKQNGRDSGKKDTEGNKTREKQNRINGQEIDEDQLNKAIKDEIREKVEEITEEITKKLMMKGNFWMARQSSKKADRTQEQGKPPCKPI